MRVRIFRPSKSAMQSGVGGSRQWVIECVSPSARQPEALMGWTSAQDTLNQVKLTFDHVDDAVTYAREQGWDYTVQVAHAKRVRPRNYADNFRYHPATEE